MQPVSARPLVIQGMLQVCLTHQVKIVAGEEEEDIAPNLNS